LELCHPAGGRPSHGDRQHAQKLVKIARVLSGDVLADRQTHTDALTTILRQKSRIGRGDVDGATLTYRCVHGMHVVFYCSERYCRLYVLQLRFVRDC